MKCSHVITSYSIHYTKLYDLIKEINSEQSILILSAYSDLDKFEKSIKIGIDGYILKPINYDILNATLYKALLNIKRFNDNKEYEERLDVITSYSIHYTKLYDNSSPVSGLRLANNGGAR